MKKISISMVCVLAVVYLTPAPAQTAGETVLHNFASPPQGGDPAAGLTSDASGNLYGTTEYGGVTNDGVVFKLDPSGNQTVLHNFAGGSDGLNPQAGVVLDAAGNIYGVTEYGGSANAGVLYKIDTGGNYSVLYSFPGGANGCNPASRISLDAAGNIYGASIYCGGSRGGVIFKVDTSNNYTVLYTLGNGYPFGTADGAWPYGGVTLDASGNIYGTTNVGGAGVAGDAYKLDTSGNFTQLHAFSDAGSDQGYPHSGVTLDAAGNLYGVTPQGGTGTCFLWGCGMVYKLDPTGNETLLYSFTGTTGGANPDSGVVLDSAGNVFGTTGGGGTANAGTVFKVDPTGNGTSLYSFQGASDGSAQGQLLLDSSGNLYGTTYRGGAANLGKVYMLNPGGQQTVLYNFPGPADGGHPYAGVIRDSAGNLYGTTYDDGVSNSGVVYALSPGGQETILYTFTGGADGANPQGLVARDPAGNLYGATLNGGANGNGVVFRVGPTGQQTVLYTFTGGADGGHPQSGVVRDPAGNLYGTTSAGGSCGDTPGCGVVFKVDPSGNETPLHHFPGGANGGYQYSGLTRDSAGNLYGTAIKGGSHHAGWVFKVRKNGHATVLYDFTGGADGGGPFSGVTLDSAGNVYGTTTGGGLGYGVVYKIDTTNHETVLYSFTGGADGADPKGNLIFDKAGNLYGTTNSGGGANFGVVFKLAPSGKQTVLYSFTGGADGSSPDAGVVRDPHGNLFGTTQVGGTSGTGVVFEIVK